MIYLSCHSELDMQLAPYRDTGESGVLLFPGFRRDDVWIPAFAGMTGWGLFMRSSISSVWADERAEPSYPGICLHQMTVDQIELSGKLPGIDQPFGACFYRPTRLKIFYNSGRIPSRHDIGRDISYNNGTGSDDTVFSDMDPFADDDAVAYPDIVLYQDRGGVANGLASVVYAVPVRIGNKSPLGKHAALSDDDLSCGADPHPRTDQGEISDFDLSPSLQIRPDGDPDLVVRRGYHRGMIAERNRPSENFDMPGLHETAPPAQVLKLRSEKVVCIPLLKIQVDAFEDIGAMVSPQALDLKLCAMGISF